MSARRLAFAAFAALVHVCGVLIVIALVYGHPGVAWELVQVAAILLLGFRYARLRELFAILRPNWTRCVNCGDLISADNADMLTEAHNAHNASDRRSTVPLPWMRYLENGQRW